MLISIAEYAIKNNKEVSSVRKKCQRGTFKTAKKIGRDWFIEETEEYSDLRKKYKTSLTQSREKI